MEIEIDISDEELGVKAIIFLQAQHGIKESEVDARCGWANMTDDQKKITMFVYYTMSAKLN